MLHSLRKRISRAHKSLFACKPAAAGSKYTGSGRRSFEPLEPRRVLDAGPLLIGEFMAINATTLADGDGDYSDWIEICNPTESAVGLTGWYLTDDADDLTKWQFPAVSLDPGEYLIVFASGKVADPPPGQLHANFQLEAEGEYLALVQDDGLTIAHQYAPEYPQQLVDISYGLSGTTAVWETLVASGAAASYHVPTAGEDVLAWTATDYDDSAWVDTVALDPAGLRITEIETGDTDWLEVQNVSDGPIDTTGWFVAVNDGASGDINAVNSQLWTLPDAFASGQVRYRTDDPGDSYWGRDIAWDAEGSGWVMVVDGAGEVVDFLAWGYNGAEIASLEISAGGFDQITVGDQWSGDGADVGSGGGQPGQEEDAIPFGSTWDYLHPLDGVNPASGDGDFNTTWMQAAGYDGPAFDGSGPGLLGFGTITYAPVVTNIGTPPSGLRYTAYFRCEFTLPSNLLDAGIEILSDDGAVIYIDGAEVTRNNISPADTYTAFADGARYGDGTSTEARTVTLPIADLAAGGHTIGVSVHQNQTGSSDLGFAMRLFGHPELAIGTALQRVGNVDGNAAADFVTTDQPTKGAQNPEITVPFGTVVPAVTGIGFSDNQPDFDAIIRTDVGEAMHDVNASLWSRLEFQVGDLPPVDLLTLRMKYDDGFVAYLNGVEVARRNALDPLAYNSNATAAHPDAQAVVFEDVDVSEHIVNTLQVGTNVLAIHGLNVSPGDEDFLLMPELIATSSVNDPQYMTAPTPGWENAQGALGRVADTTFSVDRGFYSEPFVVEISSNTADAEIRYTLDGSVPTATTETVYSGPIAVNTTTMLRAAAFLPGYVPTNVDTQTYIFPDDVLTQSRPTGYPTSWGSAPATDYEVDPEIVTDPQYHDQFLEGLTSIPTLSLVLPVADIFGSGGLYSNPGSTTMEKATSAEWIYPDGTKGFQVDAGLKMQGGASRQPNKAPKHSMSLRFRNIYGAGRLSFSLFDDSPVGRFNSLQLRAMYNNSWIHWDSGQRSRGSMIRDQWARDSLLAMGQDDAGHGTYANLYINGLYWGVYDVHERQEASHYADYNGGEEDRIDALNSGAAIDGTTASWNSLQSLVENAVGGGISLSEYQQIQQKLDVVNLVDYMIINHYGGNSDWDAHNWRAAGGGPDEAIWKIFSWDAERILEGVTTNRIGVNNSGRPSRLFQNLRNSEEFRLLFADRLHQHFFNGGAMTPENTAAHWMARANELDLSIVGESARWGDYRRDVHQYSNGPYELYTKNDHWLPEQQRLINSYFPARSGVLMNQYRSANLYPDVEAPVFYVNGSYQHGGLIVSTDGLTMPAASGTVYYTLDGSDPRLPGGAVNWGSVQVFGGSPISLGQSAAVRARAYSGGTWSALNEAEFFVDCQATAENLVVTELNYNPYDPTSAELAVNPAFVSEDFEFIELQNTSDETIDLSGVTFTVGIEFAFAGSSVTELGPHGYVVVAGSSSAFQARYGTGIGPAGQYEGRLKNGGEQITVLDWSGEPIVDFAYDDDGGWPGRADGKGASLEVIDPTAVPNAHPDRTLYLENDDYWHSSVKFGGTPGAEPVAELGVVVNEVLTHTDDLLSDSIELYNTTGSPIDVGGWYLSDSWGWESNPNNGNYKKYCIPNGTSIPALGYLVFDEDDFNPTWDDPQAEPEPNDFALNGAHGDDVWLMEADAGGKLTRFVDHVDFDAAAQGESWGRWPNGSGDLYPMLTPTLDPQDGENSGPRVGPVIFSEVHYNPRLIDPDNDLEFVEIYNSTNRTVDLTEWRIRGGIDYDFPAGTMLEASSALVVLPFELSDTDAWSAFCTEYRLEVQETDGFLGGYTGQLNDDGERIELQRPDDPPDDEPLFIPRLLEDEVRYGDQQPWPADADGGGDSLSRTEIDAWGNTYLSWDPLLPSPGQTEFVPVEDAEVVGRYIFYNHSAFDGESSAADVRDDDAIATDKEALLPGGTATLANYTSYSSGINGIMIDIDGMAELAAPDVDDFRFRVGNSDTPGSWAAAPSPSLIAVRAGAGIDGSDRVTILWPDNAIQKQWLQVTVLTTDTTRLPEEDVFYFGNAIGDSGNTTADAKVNATDMLAARNNQRTFINPAPIDFDYDYDRDARVNATDMLIARNNQTNFLTALNLITVPPGKAGEEAAAIGTVFAHDAVLQQVTADGWANREIPSGNLAWVYEFEQISRQNRPSERDNAAEKIVEKLLARSWP